LKDGSRVALMSAGLVARVVEQPVKMSSEPATARQATDCTDWYRFIVFPFSELF
jgi:hypothetical protein